MSWSSTSVPGDASGASSPGRSSRRTAGANGPRSNQFSSSPCPRRRSLGKMEAGGSGEDANRPEPSEVGATWTRPAQNLMTETVSAGARFRPPSEPGGRLPPLLRDPPRPAPDGFLRPRTRDGPPTGEASTSVLPPTRGVPRLRAETFSPDLAPPLPSALQPFRLEALASFLQESAPEVASGRVLGVAAQG